MQLLNRSLLWGLHARPAKCQSDADILSPTAVRSFFPDFVHHFLLLNQRWRSCVPQIVILGALLESPTTLNTHAQKRRFGVECLQIVFLWPSPDICISFGLSNEVLFSDLFNLVSVCQIGSTSQAKSPFWLPCSNPPQRSTQMLKNGVLAWNVCKTCFLRVCIKAAFRSAPVE